MSSRKIAFTILAISSALYFFAINSTPTAETSFASIKSVAGKKIAAIAQMTKTAPATETKKFAEQSQYEEKLAEIVNDLPTLNRASEPLVNSANEIHGFQSDEFMEGHKLAELRKLSLENEKFNASAQVAYSGCAERGDLSQSVRAICFMRAMELSIKLNNSQNIVELNVPTDIRQLALQLVN